MQTHWQEAFRAWATTPEFKQHVEEAHDLVSTTLQRYRQPYIAFSGGKDSTVLAHIALQHDPNLLVWHADYGANLIPRAWEREFEQNARLCGAKRYEVTRVNMSKGFFKPLFGHIVPEKARQGYDVVFLGLRKGESVRRKHRIGANRYYGAIPEAYPLQNWSWLDVWAYMTIHKIPIPTPYRIQMQIGVPFSEMRWVAAPRLLRANRGTEARATGNLERATTGAAAERKEKRT